jgi:hypothetical protein
MPFLFKKMIVYEWRNCILQRVTEGKIQGRIEMTGRQGRRRRKLRMTLRKGEDTLI